MSNESLMVMVTLWKHGASQLLKSEALGRLTFKDVLYNSFPRIFGVFLWELKPLNSTEDL